jgi:hypothetical protein
MVGLCVGCAQLPPVTPSVAPQPVLEATDFAALPAEQSIRWLIESERQASINGDLQRLELLWAPDSRVVDGRGTTLEDDDYVWQGRAAVLDRYRVAVFANPPPPLTLPTVLATDVNKTTATVTNGNDRWRFVHRDGRWWILELVY